MNLRFEYDNEKACVLLLDNIDTDAIIPQTELVTTSKRGLSNGLFARMRFDRDRQLKNDFVLNMPENEGAKILITGKNFGCGSSREHAVWALKEFGIEVILAPSFGAIFFRNAIKNMMLPSILDENTLQMLVNASDPNFRGLRMSISLTNRILQFETADCQRISRTLDISEDIQKRLLSGDDDIDLTLALEDQIHQFAQRHFSQDPWLTINFVENKNE